MSLKIPPHQNQAMTLSFIAIAKLAFFFCASRHFFAFVSFFPVTLHHALFTTPGLISPLSSRAFHSSAFTLRAANEVKILSEMTAEERWS